MDGFEARLYTNEAGQQMPYRLFIPVQYDKQRKYPIIVWLHGGGGAGNDNKGQISGDQRPAVMR
jgi:predicted peptidase